MLEPESFKILIWTYNAKTSARYMYNCTSIVEPNWEKIGQGS